MAYPVTTYLDIGASAVKIMEVLEDDRPPVLKSFHTFELENPKSGKTENRLLSLKEQLSCFFSEHAISNRRIALILKGTRVIMRSFLLPVSSWGETYSAAKNRILDISGMEELSTLVFVEPVKEENLQMTSRRFIKTASISKFWIEEMKNLVQTLGPAELFFYSIQDCLTGLLKLIPAYSEDKTYAIIRMSHTSTTLCISRGNLLLFSRTIPTGSVNFTKILIGEIICEGVILTTTLDEAEEIKRKQGICIEEDPEDVSSPAVKLPTELTQSMFSPLLESFTSEIKRSFTVAKNELDLDKIDELYLTGSGSEIRNLDRYFEKTLLIPTRALTVSSCVQYGTESSAERFQAVESYFTHLVGAVYNHEKRDFLLRQNMFKRLKKNLEKYYALITFCLLIVCYGLLEVYNQSFIKRTNEIEKSWAEKVVKYTNYFHFQNEKRQYIESLSCFIDFKNSQFPWIGFFKELSRRQSENISLKKLDLKRLGESRLESDYICILEGKVSGNSSLRSEKVLSLFIQELNDSPWIHSTELISISYPEGEQGAKDEKNFILQCKLDNGIAERKWLNQGDGS